MKIKLRHGDGDDTILMDLHNNIFYSFEHNWNVLSEKYNCQITYESHSGLTSEGWIETNDLIQIGTIRVDAKGMQNYKRIAPKDNKALFTYVTISAHNGITENRKGYAQLIVSDGTKIKFFNLYKNENGTYHLLDTDILKLKKCLSDWELYWDNLEQEECEDNDTYMHRFTNTIYNKDLEQVDINILVERYDMYEGWNLMRFVNLKGYNIFDDFGVSIDNNIYQILYKEFNLIRYKDKYLYVGFRKTATMVFNNIESAIKYAGYTITEDNIAYKLNKISDNDYMYYAVKFTVGLDKYGNRDITFEYEATCNYFEINPINYLTKTINRGLLRKIRKDFVERRKKQITANEVFIKLLTMKQNKIYLKESYRQGNCEYGTKQFLKEHKINIKEDNNGEYVTTKDLTARDNKNSIFSKHHFAKVIREI